jgi:hypothetical protein
VEKQKIVSQDEETILHCDNRKHIAMGLWVTYHIHSGPEEAKSSMLQYHTAYPQHQEVATGEQTG